ncbi:MAG TPA: lysylphosphatidylglycerol synthase transmembrane domain-containing protein [Streptosporangiaceae bacterium]|nr:lysylphosphatidylglycerol synthase transmembrane domain-containing protein [Streptosporangiaceae bacterium]
MPRHPRNLTSLRTPAQLRTSPWVRLGLVALAVGFCAYGLVAQRAEVATALRHLHWYSVALAILAAIAGLGFMMLAWRSLLADLGSPIRLRPATRVMFIGQLGKYVPGMVWAFAAQVELAREYNVPRKRSASATAVGMAVTLATGLLVAAIALPLTSHSAASHYWWLLACAPLLLVALYPPLLGAALDFALKLARQPPLERRVSMPGLIRCVGWTALGWACYGLQLWLLVADVSGHGGVVLLSVGAYALAWSVGFLLVIFPSGVGPRELALIAALAPVLPRGSALVVAIVSRLVMTTGDLAWAGIALALGRDRAAPPGRTLPGGRAGPAHDNTQPGQPGSASRTAPVHQIRPPS